MRPTAFPALLLTAAVLGCTSQDVAMPIDEDVSPIDWSLVDLSPDPSYSFPNPYMHQLPSGRWYWTDDQGNPTEPPAHAQSLGRRGTELVFAPLEDVRAELAELDDVQAGPLCGNEGETEMVMQHSYTDVEIWQDELTMDVKWFLYADQETTRIHPPGQPQQEARHQVDMYGTKMYGGGAEQGLTNPSSPWIKSPRHSNGDASGLDASPHPSTT